MRQVFAATALAGRAFACCWRSIAAANNGPAGSCMASIRMPMVVTAVIPNGLKVALGITVVQEPGWNHCSTLTP